MSKSKSSSSSSTQNYDQRATADNGGIAVGQGGYIINEFPEEVADFATQLTDIVKASVENSQKAVENSQSGIQAIAQREQSSALFAQDVLEKVMPLAVIAGITIIGYTYVRGKR